MVSPHVEVKEKRRSVGWIILLIILIIFFGAFMIFGIDIIFGKGQITGNFVAVASESTEKLECKQQEYNDLEYYNEQVPYEDIEYYAEKTPYKKLEYYTQNEAGNNCDSDPDCNCLHKSWLGLGSCDSCSCTRTRYVTDYKDETKSKTVIKYKPEQKTRTVTKYKTVCIKLKKWQSPNYNENWLDYPELYDKNGERIK